MRNKFLKPEIEIIKFLTEDVVYTSDYTYGETDDFGNGTNIPNVGGLS